MPKLSPNVDDRERELNALIRITRSLRKESQERGAMTAAVATIKQERDLLNELAAYRRQKATSHVVDVDGMIAEIPKLIDQLPEAAFIPIAQAVDTRRRNRLRKLG